MILLAGHDSIEFGWLVCRWIPYLRSIKDRYEKIAIVCRPGHEPLYEFADEFVTYEKKGKPDRWMCNWKRQVKIPKRIRANYKNARVRCPNETRCTKGPFTYFPYGDKEKGPKYDIVIHARAERRYNQTWKNWPVENYARVLKSLNGAKACCIGTDAYRIPRSDDLRGIPLKELCNILASAKVVIGPSSGPMHLAHLCGAPIVVWTGKEHHRSINGTNRKRYKKLWRAWDTPVKIIDREGWQPSPSTVVSVVRKFL